MANFHILPVDEALMWIRAWTDHTWPISLEEAFRIRDRLKWVPSPLEPRYFTTKLSINGKEDGIIFESDGHGIQGVRFNLSSILPNNRNNEINLLSQEMYSHYVTALEHLWGPRRTGEKKYETTQSHWKLPNGSSISIIRATPLISINIESPWLTQISEEYDRAMEDYG